MKGSGALALGLLAAVVAALVAGAACQADAELPPWLDAAEGQTPVSEPAATPTEPEAPEAEEEPTTTKVLPQWKQDQLEKEALFAEEPAEVVISAVLPVQVGSQVEFIQLKNIGGQSQDLEGWRLVVDGPNGEETHKLAGKGCPQSMDAQSSLLITKKSPKHPCGFEFDLGRDDNLILYEAGEEAEGMDSVSWGGIAPGNVLYRVSSDAYEHAPPNVEGSIMEVLTSLGEFEIMKTFLKHFNLDEILKGNGVRDRNKWYSDYIKEMPTDEPYTLFAVRDEDWQALLQEMAGEWAPPLTPEELLEIDDTLVFDIVTFLMVRNSWNTRSLKLKNRDGDHLIPFQSAHPDRKAVVKLDSSGSLLFNQDCVDAPPAGEYGCDKQRAWGKCGEDWMNDNGFFSGRPLGYCEITCEKCSCSPLDDNCAKVVIADVNASSGRRGVVHVLDRLVRAPAVLKNPEQEQLQKEEELKNLVEEDNKKDNSRRRSSGGGGGGGRRTWGWWG